MKARRLWLLLLALTACDPRRVLTRDDGRDLFRVQQADRKFGYMDRAGQIVIPPQFDDAALIFSDGLAAVRLGDLHGYIDRKGSYVINPQFDGVIQASGLELEAMLMVAQSAEAPQWPRAARSGDKWGFVDRAGTYLINPQFRQVLPFSEGLAVAWTEKAGFIDNTGNYVITPQFDGALPFEAGLAAVKSGGKWGFIDRAGKYVINPQFDEALGYRNGLALVGIDDHYGYIDRAGQYVWNLQ